MHRSLLFLCANQFIFGLQIMSPQNNWKLRLLFFFFLSQLNYSRFHCRFRIIHNFRFCTSSSVWLFTTKCDWSLMFSWIFLHFYGSQTTYTQIILANRPDNFKFMFCKQLYGFFNVKLLNFLLFLPFLLFPWTLCHCSLVDVLNFGTNKCSLMIISLKIIQSVQCTKFILDIHILLTYFGSMQIHILKKRRFLDVIRS